MGGRQQGSPWVPETITGEVIPNEWDGSFRVTGVVIACDKERDLLVDHAENHPDLLENRPGRVQATGLIRTDGGREYIRILSYNRLDDSRYTSPGGTTLPDIQPPRSKRRARSRKGANKK